MHSIISHLFHTTGAIKLLSTENGRIKLQTINDVKIYAHTQGVFYFTHKGKYKNVKYHIQLAELMRSENRHHWAAYCYLEALDFAWRILFDIAVFCEKDDNNEFIDPCDIYKTARLHLLETENPNGLKKLKKLHQRFREYAHHESAYTLVSRDIERKKRIETLFDKDFPISHCSDEI